jgi:tRNA-Thr(GGU) m(6)t(6)A37 methyltransferase TsaA
MSYQLNSIGRVESTNEGLFCLHIDAPYRAALKQLEQFSHVIVFWWADQHDNAQDRAVVESPLPYAPGVIAGVFASRSEYRPNPIAMSVCPIFEIDQENGTVTLFYIDALDGTPLIDLKPYVPISDRVRDVKVAPWFAKLPSWMEEGATVDWEAFFNPVS